MTAADELRRLLSSDEFTSADLETFLAYALIASGAQPADAPVAQFMGAFAFAIGLDAASTPAETEAALQRYFSAHPVHPRLRQELDRIALAAAGATDEERRRTAANVVGAVAAAIVPAASAAPPAGSVRGGPFARSRLNEK